MPPSVVEEWNGITLIRDDLGVHKPRLYERALSAQRIVEIGTRDGNSTRIFDKALQNAGRGGGLTSIDLDPPRNDWPAQHPVPHTTFLPGDSLTVAWAQEIDLLFIDGNHDHDQVIQELKKYGPWVHVGGRILLHDILQNAFGNGVMKATAKWCDEVKLSWTVHVGGHGLGEIEVTHDLRRQ